MMFSLVSDTPPSHPLSLKCIKLSCNIFNVYNVVQSLLKYLTLSRLGLCLFKTLQESIQITSSFTKRM